MLWADADLTGLRWVLPAVPGWRWNWFAVQSGAGDTYRVRLLADTISPDEVLRHPHHEAAQQSLAELIVQLALRLHPGG
jgi:hypothetical protein